MALRKETIKQQMNEALASVLEPGESQSASILAISGLSPWLASGLFGLIWQFFTKYYYVTVTDRRVIFLRTSQWSQRPQGIAFTEPRSGVTIEEYRPGRVWNVLRIRRSGGERLRLNVHRFWREELNAVVQALQSA